MDTPFTHINVWITAAFKSPILLGGYWDDYPTLKKSFVVMNVIQIVLGLSFFTFILYYAFKKRILDADWTIKLVPDRFSLSSHILIPLLVCAWEMSLGAMQIALAYTWYSAASMSMVYIHSQIEWWLVVVRIAMLFQSERGCCDHRGLQVFTLVSLFFTFSTSVTFTTTSNPRIQGALAGVAFFTDFALFLVVPISLFKSWHKKEAFGSQNAVLGEILITILCFVHILEFYPPIWMVLSAERLKLAGRWLNAWGWINMAFFIPYIIYAILGLETAARVQRQKERVPLLND